MAEPRRPRIARATVTPILISDPPLLNVLGVHQPYTPRAVIEIETDSGVTGVGETYGDQDYLAVAHSLAKRVTGAPLTCLNSLVDQARESTALREHTATDSGAGGLRGTRTADQVARSVASGFEVACFDALGKTLGLPVHALLGGKLRDRVQFSGYLFYKWAEHPHDAAPDDWGEALDPDGIVAQAHRMTQLYGFGSYKLKGGVFPPEEEIAAVQALAREFPERPLRIDPNGGWSAETSIRVAQELGDVIEYLEDPSQGLTAMSRVHRETGVPLATNMLVTSFDEIKPAFDENAVQVVLSDHHFWGGLQATRCLAAICQTFGVGLSMHSNTHLGISLAAMTHVASVIPQLDSACDTHRPWQTEDVITNPQTFVDGAIEVPDAPGLGVEVDRGELTRMHGRYLDMPQYHDRDDVAAMVAARPDWQRPRLPRW